MKTLGTFLLMATMVFCGKSFALGIDVGPVHIHTKGAVEKLKIVIDTIVLDKDTKAIVKVHAHRKGDHDDKFEINISMADLDEESRKLILKSVEVDVIYKANIEKLEDNWKLISIRKNSDD